MVGRAQRDPLLPMWHRDRRGHRPGLFRIPEFVRVVGPNIVRHAPHIAVDAMDAAWGMVPDALKGGAVVGVAAYASNRVLGKKRKIKIEPGTESDVSSFVKKHLPNSQSKPKVMPRRYKRKRSKSRSRKVRFKFKRKRSRSRRGYKKRRRSRSRGVTKRGVKQMIRRSAMNSIPMDFRQFTTGSQTSAINQCAYYSHQHLNAASINGIIDKTLPTLNSSGTKTFHDLSGGDRSITVKSLGGHVEYEFANNFGFDAMLTFWILDPKENTSVLPETMVEEGLDELVADSTGAAITDAEDKIMYWPSDSQPFKRFFKIKKRSKVLLKAGESCKVVVPLPKGIYRPTDNALEAETHRKGVTRFLMWRQEGTCSHDTTTKTLIGISNTKIDFTCKLRWKYKFMTSRQSRHSEFNYDTDAVAAAEQMKDEFGGLIDNAEAGT